MRRRDFLLQAGWAAAGALCAPLVASQAAKTRLILLGTGGGPRPRAANSASAQVIVINGEAYVIDCGDGVARQLVTAGIPLPTLRHVFLTHHHSDHNADYGNLLWLAWTAGLRNPVDTWGPPPLEEMTRLFLQMNATDIKARIEDEQRVPLAPLVRPHELTRAGVILRGDHVQVTAALVPHAPLAHAFAYRFDSKDRSIVISGDTAMSDALVQLARGADILVHEAMYIPGVDRIVANVPNAPRLKDSIIAHHTSAEDAGRVAQRAGVKTLVLSHFVPPDDPTIADDTWRDAARAHFSGTVIVGKDLMEI
jgi:ribonuclease BN (tRNA processing enzyme)